MTARSRALIVVVVAALAGVGVWTVRPDLLEEPVAEFRVELAAWQDSAGAWRQQGLDWWADIRRKGAEMANSARQAVGLEPSAPEPAAPPPPPPVPAVRHVVWATADGQLLRAEVPGAAHEDFVTVLRQTQSEDLNRLARLAEQRFRHEAEPLVADVASRLPAYMDEALGSSVQFSAVSEAFSAMDSGMAPAVVKEKALRVVGDRLAGLYRQHVLRPDVTVAALRGVSGKVIADVQTDLLRSCDRYDDAFQSFLRANVKQVQALSPDGRWVGVAWQGTNASFRSLCQTLRGTGVASSWFDEAVLRTAGEPTMAAHELIKEMARPAAGVVEGMMSSYDGVFTTLSGYGLPQPLAKASALVWSYGASSPAVLSHVLGLGMPADLRVRTEPALLQATKSGMLDAVGSLNAALVTFVDGELAGIASAVTARVDGSWSRN